MGIGDRGWEELGIRSYELGVIKPFVVGASCSLEDVQLPITNYQLLLKIFGAKAQLRTNCQLLLKIFGAKAQLPTNYQLLLKIFGAKAQLPTNAPCPIPNSK